VNQVDELIQKHRAGGLLVDANLLVLYLVGRTNKQRISTFKRTQMYTIEDFELLERLMAQFGSLVTTPHLLTEVSNLATLHTDELQILRRLFKETVFQMQEFYDESRSVVADAAFERLGLTDAAVATLCRRSMLVLTDDLQLYLALLDRGVDSINFNHIRTFFWQP
jgi:predicted nucleic acid-binding protein